MRRLLLFTFGFALTVSVAAAPASAGSPGLARFMSADKDRVELKDGRGTAIFTARGAIFGFFKRGSLRVFDMPRGMKTDISVDGAERVRRVSNRTTVYSGRHVSFYIGQGWWRARIQGRGIDAGAAVHGTLALSGQAGWYQIRDGPFRAWPSERRVFRLG